MRFRRDDGLRHGELVRGRSMGRWVVVAVGLAVLGAAFTYAVNPYQVTREFRRVVDCEGSADCFASEPGSISDRRTYTTTHTDADGFTHTTTHYEVTWERANGACQSRDVSASFYHKAREGQPANLRVWHGDVVGVEVMGGSQWFLPESGRALGLWLHVAWLGLGVLLWGLFFGWWDGVFMLAFRTFSWMFMSVVPVSITTSALAYGWEIGVGLVVRIVLGLFFVGVGGALLLGSLKRW